MRATWMRKRKGGESIDRLLGLLCAVPLLTLVGGCLEESSAGTAGHELHEPVQRASESSESAVEEPGREAVEQQVDESAEALEETENASHEAGHD